MEEDREEAALAAVPAAASEEDLVEADLAEALEALIARPIITIIIIKYTKRSTFARTPFDFSLGIMMHKPSLIDIALL